MAANIIFIEPKDNRGNPMNKNVFLKNLNKCQASVVKTKILEEPKNFSSLALLSFHLLTHERLGFQNVCLYLY